MKQFCVFLILLVAANASPINPRIVNGTDAQEGEYPYVVSLRTFDRHNCGGTILNSEYVLTAAHCVCDNSVPLDADFFSIQYGSVEIVEGPGSPRTIQVSEVHCNKFSMNLLTFDSAVLKLAEKLPETNNWSPVTLSKTFDTSEQQDGTIIGWGRLYQDGPIPDILQKLEVEVYDDDLCGKQFNNIHHICFGAKVGGACNGDSGTALIVDGMQVGIASFITEECGIANKTYPNVYSRVATYYDWIADIAGLDDLN